MIKIRRALPVAVALAFIVASCGGSSDEGGSDSEPSSTSAETVADDTEDFTEAEESEPEEAAEPEVTEAEEAEPEEAAPEETVAEPTDSVAPAEEPDETAEEGEVVDGTAAGFDVALSEWAVTAPNAYPAGEITFNASNGGSFPHELVVIEGEGYEALPLAEGGAVIEDDLPTGALIGRTGRLGGGGTEALVVTLAPGNYVLVCNLGGGNNSHAGQGQRLDITVT